MMRTVKMLHCIRNINKKNVETSEIYTYNRHYTGLHKKIYLKYFNGASHLAMTVS